MMGFYLITVFLLLGVRLNEATTSSVCSNQETTSSSDAASVKVATEPCFDLQSFDYVEQKKSPMGSEVSLECFVQNKVDFAVSWLHNDDVLSYDSRLVKPDPKFRIDSDGERRFNLIIADLETSKKGTYVCQIITLVTKRLEYKLDVLEPPKLERIPNDAVFVLSQGEDFLVKCLATGNPTPVISWSKQGEKAVHTTVDDIKNSLKLTNVDESHADLYSCTAKNGVGHPVTSEFQIFIKFKPKVRHSDEVNIKQSVLYTSVGKREEIKCLVDSYPLAKMSLMLNDEIIPAQSYTYEENKEEKGQYVLTYSLVSSTETFGMYKCIAENDLGISVAEIKVTPHISEIKLGGDKMPSYSDAIVFEWSLFSGSAINELNVQVFGGENGTNVTNLVSKTKQISPDNDELVATYHNENIIYKDFYDLTKLVFNTSYTIRLRAKNEFGEWSEWSQNLTLKTSADEREKITQHRSSHMHHHYKLHHDKKHKQYQMAAAGRDLNGKREMYNSYNDMLENTATTTTSFMAPLIFTITTLLVRLLN